MAKLTTKARNNLSKSQFALPAQKKYPIENASHARNALARASQQHHAGNLSDAEYAQVRSAARAKLRGA